MPTATTRAPHVIYRSSYALLGMFLMNFSSISVATRGVSSSYSSNDFQDSNKIKSTENKTLGYLSRVLFFNVFELGAENCESSNIK
jgi:hypothetical protein